jgi:SAM-dependent methyltransferase
VIWCTYGARPHARGERGKVGRERAREGEGEGGVTVHPAAGEGFNRAEGVEAYERARPTYPPDAVAWLVATLGIGPGTALLDLAAGTGKLTRLLAPTGARLVAVEPAPAMRERLSAALPGVPVLAGTAEAVPLPDGAVDAATVAQAFHWFDAPAALRELHRVLRPGGGLALLWNVREDTGEWDRHLTDLVAGLRGENPWYGAREWEPAFAAAADRFEPAGEAVFRHAQPVTPDEVVDRIASISYVARLPDDRRAAVLDGIRRHLATHPETAGRDRLSFAYRTDVYCWRRLAAYS